MIITIDGYSGCFKTRLSNDLASRLGILCLNTGDFYRVLAAAWLDGGAPQAIEEWLAGIQGAFFIRNNGTPFIGDADYKGSVRSKEVDNVIAGFASQLSVREFVNSEVKSFADKQNIIAEGRDMGTIVFPEARHKLFLTTKTHQDILHHFECREIPPDGATFVAEKWGERWVRDYIDMSRAYAPVRPHADARIVDVSDGSYEEVLSYVESLVHPLVSFIVPFYNAGSSIGRCVDSIRKSCSATYEILIVDDGSTEFDYRTVQSIAMESRDIYLIKSTHMGVSEARNQALDQIGGDYVIFCDADDEMLPGGGDELIEGLNHGSSITVGNVRKKSSPRIGVDRIIGNKEAIQLFFRTDKKRLLGTVYGKAFRRKDIADLKFDLNLRIGEDALFLLQCLLRAKTICLKSKYVYSHSNNPSGLIQSSDASVYEDAIAASAKMIGAVHNKGDMFRYAAIDLWNVFLRCCLRFNSSKSRERFYERMSRVMEEHGFSFIVRDLRCYLIICQRFVASRVNVVIGSGKNPKMVLVDGSHAPFYARCGFVNLHIHLGDFNYTTQGKFSSLEHFLSIRNGMRDGHSYEEAVARNVAEGARHGDYVFCYASKITNSPICQIVHLRKRGAIDNRDDGVFIENVTKLKPHELISLMSDAQQRSLPVFMHISSSLEQDADERTLYGGSLVQFLDLNCLLNQLVYLVHATYLIPKELTTISKKGANVIICPLANLSINEQVLRPERLDYYRIQWFLGSDSHFTTNASSISSSARLLIKQGYRHTNKLLENMTTKPVTSSQCWRHPLRRYYCICFKDSRRRLSARNLIDTPSQKCYLVSLRESGSPA